jgi:hypothetical protein
MHYTWCDAAKESESRWCVSVVSGQGAQLTLSDQRMASQYCIRAGKELSAGPACFAPCTVGVMKPPRALGL